LTSFSERDDAELLAHICNGNHQAFATLVQRHTESSYAIALRFMGDRDEAEDIVQSAFLKLWERPSMWNPGSVSRFTTWFYRVVVNLCLDWRKRKKPLLLTEPIQSFASSESQEEGLILTEQQMFLETQINALPARQRTAINLCYLGDLSNKEAADVMGISLRALQSLVMRAKEKLKKRLKRMP
jgi:RNA polymerase sigma-70 factor (ECF subfamily)